MSVLPSMHTPTPPHTHTYIACRHRCKPMLPYCFRRKGLHSWCVQHSHLGVMVASKQFVKNVVILCSQAVAWQAEELAQQRNGLKPLACVLIMQLSCNMRNDRQQHLRHCLMKLRTAEECVCVYVCVRGGGAMTEA
jgi:aspartokinase-like uncharacterized kinase